MDVKQLLEWYLESIREYEQGQEREVYPYTRYCIQGKKLMYEDILWIGYLRVLIGAIRPMDYISQVVIDEAQDYNMLQLKILKKLYPKSRFTILADPNQAVYQETSTVNKKDFREVFGEHIKEMTLEKSYRSTAPINRYALNLLGIDDPNRYVDRPGKEPEIITGDMPGALLEQVLRQIPEKSSVGILTCDKESAVRLRNLIGQPLKNEERPVQYIFHPDRMLAEKIVVMPILLAKGLEFDVVIVWDDKDEAYWDENKNLKYLMCTRALHELYFIKGR